MSVPPSSDRPTPPTGTPGAPRPHSPEAVVRALTESIHEACRGRFSDIPAEQRAALLTAAQRLSRRLVDEGLREARRTFNSADLVVGLISDDVGAASTVLARLLELPDATRDVTFLDALKAMPSDKHQVAISKVRAHPHGATLIGALAPGFLKATSDAWQFDAELATAIGSASMGLPDGVPMRDAEVRDLVDTLTTLLDALTNGRVTKPVVQSCMRLLIAGSGDTHATLAKLLPRQVVPSPFVEVMERRGSAQAAMALVDSWPLTPHVLDAVVRCYDCSVARKQPISGADPVWDRLAEKASDVPPHVQVWGAELLMRVGRGELAKPLVDRALPRCSGDLQDRAYRVATQLNDAQHVEAALWQIRDGRQYSPNRMEYLAAHKTEAIAQIDTAISALEKENPEHRQIPRLRTARRELEAIGSA